MPEQSTEPPFDSRHMRRIGPGIYDDGAGGMHLDVSEMLRANGWPDTPANRDAIEQAARDMFGDDSVETHDV